jgi:hypothetical protein
MRPAAKAKNISQRIIVLLILLLRGKKVAMVVRVVVVFFIFLLATNSIVVTLSGLEVAAACACAACREGTYVLFTDYV